MYFPYFNFLLYLYTHEQMMENQVCIFISQQITFHYICEGIFSLQITLYVYKCICEDIFPYKLHYMYMYISLKTCFPYRFHYMYISVKTCFPLDYITCDHVYICEDIFSLDNITYISVKTFFP